jgi:hypothetical protein
LRRARLERQAACVVTQVEVDPDDPAMRSPSKPIGPFFSAEEAKALEAKGWRMTEDAGRGWRHCVASPEPRAIINLRVIEALLQAGTVVIAGGGGGIPVVRGANGDWQGVQAVVDKDLTSALLARSLGIPDLLILTAVERVAIDFNTPRQRFLDTVSLAQLKAYHAAGHFGRGSMGPKVEAAIRHLEGEDAAPSSEPWSTPFRRSRARAGPMSFEAESAGRFAREALQGGEGEVCALFRRSFYLRCPGERYACVGAPSVGNGPLNVLVPDLALPRLGDRVGVSFSRAKPWQPPPPVADQPRLDDLTAAAGHRIPAEGFGCLVIGKHNALSGHAQPALDALERWLVGNAIAGEAAQLIGLGPGLTPSGDDYSAACW